MALKACPECGHDMSTRADACPECGYRRSRVFAGVLLVIVILLLVFLFMA
jgi:RNA polymerase subunit RPABC4/transcription elongation factor Spt4